MCFCCCWFLMTCCFIKLLHNKTSFWFCFEWCKTWEVNKKRSWTENEIRLMVTKEIISMWKYWDYTWHSFWSWCLTFILIVSLKMNTKEIWRKNLTDWNTIKMKNGKRTWQLHLHQSFLIDVLILFSDCFLFILKWLYSKDHLYSCPKCDQRFS